MAITETAYAEAQAEIGRLRTALENQMRECDRAWREADAIANERNNHARWRQDLAYQLSEAEKQRDALAVALNKATACGEMLAAVAQGAKGEFVRVPYGASHEDVAAINDWHKMAAEALREWESDR